jgi:cellulose synthase (UDP-forming)
MDDTNSGKCLGDTRELGLTFAALAWTGVVWLLLGADMFNILTAQLSNGDFFGAGNQAVFMVIIAFMQFSVLVYFLTRLSQLYRHRAHRVPEPEELMGLYQTEAPRLVVLVPSYKEDPSVVRKTLLSAALMDYPAKRVVLLIDDPPAPGNVDDRTLLEQTRQLVENLQDSLNGYARPFRAALNDFSQRDRVGELDIKGELLRLADLYDRAAMCLEEIRVSTRNLNHEDQWFIVENLAKPAAAHRAHAATLREKAISPGAEDVVLKHIAKEYFRLSRLFTADISAFERKCYVNLSHEQNKAMNLNSYIGLMGKSFVAEFQDDGQHLRQCWDRKKAQFFPDADFVITLDADSTLSPDYALKLLSVMNTEGNERVAVVQTPYSAFPGADSPIERTAGATTDIQYLVHQGFTSFNATFWVGANALLRKSALVDIVTHDRERGFPVARYIQDRTVIEDTESSIDLVVRGWSLFNYPERLAYSATPPDFGSLLIQRRRWANGGLIIFPKFWRYVTRRASIPSRIGHTLMGTHYLTSLAVMNIGILVLLWLPVEQPMRSPWLPLAMLPYLVLYTRDLLRTGYRIRDMFGVYALTLLLVPVHLGGVFKSIAQIITGVRTPFGRTPKVVDRTAVPLLYLAATYGLLLYCGITLLADVETGRWLHALFAATNGGFLAFGIIKFVGLRETVQDLRIGLTPWLARSMPEPEVAPAVPESSEGMARRRA